MRRIESLRMRERDALLTRLRTVLQDDPRVLAAWLHGSLGRGEGDAWSDLDVWVVLRDDAYDPNLRHVFASRMGETIFTEEAPQNGPSGGAYLMAAYDAPTGPHLVDWYFQPLIHARQTTSARVLLDRTSLSTGASDDAPRASWSPSAEEEVQNKAALFWAMILIQAKRIARRPEEHGLDFEGFLRTLIREVFLSQGTTDVETETPELRSASDRLDRLTDLGKTMAEAVPAWAGPWEKVKRLIESVRAFTTEMRAEQLSGGGPLKQG